MGNNKEITRIEFTHQGVHDGDTYHYHITDDTMADTETIIIAFKTPATTVKEIHMVIDFSAKVAGHLEIIEAATWTKQSGTKATPINVKRGSNNESYLSGNETTTTFTEGEIAHGVTTILTTNATTIETIYTFDAKKYNTINRELGEWILKGGTTYVIRFTADGASNAGDIRMRWYEYLPNTV